MNADRLREFYERAGYRVATTSDANWYVPGGRVWRNFPCGATIAPSPDDIGRLCRDKGIIGVEWGNSRGIGAPSGVWSLRDRSYGADSVQRQFRQQMLHALERESVREIGFGELERVGAKANRDTAVRLGHDVHHLTDATRWRKLCEAGRQTAGAGAFATFGSDGLTAYLVCFIAGDTCYGLIAASVDAARRAGSAHALYFTYAQTSIRRPGVERVTLGVQSLPPVPGVDRMKRHAGFRLESFHLAIALRPAVRSLVASPIGALGIEAGRRLLGSHPAVRRADALRAILVATDDAGAGRPPPTPVDPTRT